MYILPKSVEVEIHTYDVNDIRMQWANADYVIRLGNNADTLTYLRYVMVYVFFINKKEIAYFSLYIPYEEDPDRWRLS